jgi:glycosyltransferase involved in cell wall biosynthesis
MKKTSNKLSSLTILFPTYNEAGNIEESIHQALDILPQVAEKFQILVVNDGSTDATAQIVRRLKKKHRAIRLITQKNAGYGGALKTGFAAFKTEWLFFTDSDLQFDLSELKKLVRKANQSDLVIGYRLVRAEGWKRSTVAKLLKIWNRIFLRFPREIKDIDCAFKLMHRRVVQQFSPLASSGAMISTEFLLKSYRAGIPIIQVGVHHYQRRSGSPTGNNRKVIFRAIKETIHLRRVMFQQKVSLLSPSLKFLR